MPRVLITGGAGFIGSHLADRLLHAGYEVRALDILDEQVHGPNQERPEYLDSNVELIVGDVRDPSIVRRALNGVNGVFHLAAAVGVGQSMYEIARYTDVNSVGTAVLLEAMIERKVKRLLVASSMSIYGEGLYKASDGSIVSDASRTRSDLESGEWELHDNAGNPLIPIPTSEKKTPSLASVYALSKYDQERMTLIVGEAYGIRATALRLFNVFGTRQALSNPYTGVLAIFASNLLNGNAPKIFEDGLQQRDFVSVSDVAKAFHLAYETDAAAGLALNVGSGRAYTILEIAQMIASFMEKDIEPEVTGTYRVGDIRHCFADISAARSILGFTPDVQLKDGLPDLVDWLNGQTADDNVEYARAQLAARKLEI
ncbi:MAG TPA: SDR family NAD(P)-dependent oxidoreductase [Gemmatimonadaceae bacterium]|nr:SDR family NAD(P)-dependent oxidoreductase [Gemmatimonadaceae bacterium]